MATNALKNVLVNEGITQTELARESGLSAGAINKFCSGKRTPSPTTKNKIVKTINRLPKKTNNNYDVGDIFPKRRR
jgi:transcriptional regulator with XRE-family HTH domain